MKNVTRSCRFCGAHLDFLFLDLGTSPLANSYVKEQELQRGELFYPLRVYVCGDCFLVQLEKYENPDHIFNNYAYYSSYSTGWLKHAENYVRAVIARFNIHPQSRVIELGSNDGYLLQYFKQHNIPVIGIDPAANVSKVAQDKGIPTLTEFFCKNLAVRLAAQGFKADLLVGNNILAHVPDILDFVAGIKISLKPTGIVTMEFPHLLRLMQENQFDTIYHEHFSYFSMIVVQKIFQYCGLNIFDVEEIPTHGGSLRIYAGHSEDKSKVAGKRVKQLLAREVAVGLNNLGSYSKFAEKATTVRFNTLEFLIAVKRQGKRIVGYGAPAKGNTLLNYCGIRNDFLEYTVDKSPHKQGLYLPGSRIPIYHPDLIKKTKPDFLFILPWNLKEEIIEEMSFIRQWEGKFFIVIPGIEVF